MNTILYTVYLLLAHLVYPGDRIPVEARFSAPVQTALWPTLYSGYRVLTGVKRPGPGVDHPPQSSAEVKERVELYLYSPCGPSWSVLQ